MFADCALRVVWTFTLWPTLANPYFADGALIRWSVLTKDVFRGAIQIAEVFRRCVWAIFRVEKVHHAHKAAFASLEYVPLLYEHQMLMARKAKRREGRSLWRLWQPLAIFAVLLVVGVVIVDTGLAFSITF